MEKFNGKDIDWENVTVSLCGIMLDIIPLRGYSCKLDADSMSMTVTRWDGCPRLVDYLPFGNGHLVMIPIYNN